jgi:protein-S-isoprenylcysteine O-methyltransferase Ste14
MWASAWGNAITSSSIVDLGAQDSRPDVSAPLRLPLAVALLGVLAVVVPLVRFRLRHGTWAVVVERSPEPVERFVGRVFGITLAALACWTVAYAVLGPDRLGVWPPPPPIEGLGWAAYVLAAAVVIAGQATMGPSWRIGIDDRPTALVASGIYRHVRHPIYAGMITFTVALALLAPSPFTFVAVPFVAFEIGVQARLEEAHMERQHGDAWRAYAASAGRFVPRISRRVSP